MKKEKLVSYASPDVECMAIGPVTCIADSLKAGDGLPQYDENTPTDWDFDD